MMNKKILRVRLVVGLLVVITPVVVNRYLFIIFTFAADHNMQVFLFLTVVGIWIFLLNIQAEIIKQLREGDAK